MTNLTRLILLNGPPGVGKSTLARAWAEAHPSARVVEVDHLRTTIDGWEDDEETRLEARKLALAATAEHLLAGHDVVVPQYLGRLTFIEELDRVASNAHARFVELMMVTAEDVVIARFRARRDEVRASGAPHPEGEVADDDVAALISDALHRLGEVRASRSATVVLDGDHSLEAIEGVLAR